MIESFGAAIGDNCHTLILGSIPGVKSLRDQQYYAHPRNAFWPIIQALYGVDINLEYSLRLQALNQKGVALWDVLQRCERHGSLDSAIQKNSMVSNAIPELLASYPSIRKIGLNGATANKAFRKEFPQLLNRQLEIQLLPSSSPAFAAMPYDAKLAAWKAALV